jgi:purine catabolism regulator
MVSVADVLAVEYLHLGAAHLPSSEQEVRWVATSELVDPAPFLEGGELLLTTGLSTRGWRTEWEGYVARLVGAGVVALGLASGMTHRRPPVGLVRACERHGLNLLEVPRRTAFVAVSRATARLLEEAERQAARDALAMQRELTTAALASQDGSALPLKLAGLVRGAAALLAPDGHPLAAPSGPRVVDLDLASVTAELARIRPQGLRAASSLSSPSGVTMLHPLGVRPRPSAYLAVLLPGRASEAQRSAVRTAVSLLGLASERAEERRDSDRALTDRAMELMLAGDDRGAELVLGARSRPATLPARVVVVRAVDPSTTGARAGAREAAASAALEDARDATEEAGLLVSLAAAELWAVLPAGRADGHAESLARSGLFVGIGETVARDRLRHGYDTAGHALERAAAGSPVVSWERVVRGGVLGLLDPDKATAFATDLLAPLAELPELQLTLLTFLKHNGSRLKVAEELGIHRNTVRHRLRQVEELTGLALDDPADRVSAWVALQALPAQDRRGDADGGVRRQQAQNR